MVKANSDLREATRAAGVPLWKIAETLGISEPTMTRKLRRELPRDEKAKIYTVIERIKAAPGKGVQ